MQVNVKKTVTRLLVLTEEEAAWLAAIMQNPMYGTPEEESPEDREMRMRFWNALTKEGD